MEVIYRPKSSISTPILPKKRIRFTIQDPITIEFDDNKDGSCSLNSVYLNKREITDEQTRMCFVELLSEFLSEAEIEK